MEPFKLSLPDGAIISGGLRLPCMDVKPVHLPPLIVCVPGGSFDSKYFDANDKHSIFSLSTCLKIPIVAIDRPGYGASTQTPSVGSELTYAQAQGKYLNSTVFPALWKEFADRAQASAIVLLSHSIGAMMAIIAAGSYTGAEGYPLAGIITSGIGSELAGGSKGIVHLLNDATDLIRFDSTVKDAIMLQLPHMNLASAEMRQFTEHLNQPASRGELYDMSVTWFDYWKDYTTQVNVPLLHGLGEFDGLWASTREALESYKAAFPRSPKVTGDIIPMAPHCMELSFQSQAWYMKCCAFAIECTVAQTLRSAAQVNSDCGTKEGSTSEGVSSAGGITSIV